jgi:hypothetical protein
MKSLLVTILLALTIVGFSNAQGKMALGAGVIVSLPMGSFGDAANTGFGGTAAFELGFMPNLVGIGQVGYLTWGTDAANASFSAVPVLVGVKYFFVPGVGFYGTGQLGLSFFSVETPSIHIPGVGTVGGGSASESEFTFVVGAGYEVPVSPTFSLDFTGAFNIISDLNHISIRAGGKVAL